MPSSSRAARRAAQHPGNPAPDAEARMYRERAAARAAGRRLAEVASAYAADPLEPLTDALADALVAAGTWPAAARQALGSLAAEIGVGEVHYSAARRTVWSPDLTAAEFPELADAPPGTRAAYEFTPDGRLHLRAVLPR